jgi:hypothetical protein
MKEIIDEYLRHDYIVEEEETEDKKYIKIKNMLDNENINEYDEGGIRNILMSESETSGELDDLENNMDYLNSLIYDRPAYTESVQPTVGQTPEKRVDDKKPDDIVLEPHPEQPKQEEKHEDLKINSDDEFMKKIQSGEYVNELRDIRGSRNNTKRTPEKTQEHPQTGNNSHNKQTETKSLDIKPTKVESDDIDVIKDKIKDATNDKNVFFSTMFNK